MEAVLERFAELCPQGEVDMELPWPASTAAAKRWGGDLRVEHYPCSAGRDSLMVLVDGTVVACEALPDPELACGDVEANTLGELWDSPVLRFYRGGAKLSSCGGCAEEEGCGGGCRTLAYLSTGALDGADPACAEWRKQGERVAAGEG
jgi:radical SAM protein with 4Fe4S-binding SPASM domain